MRGKGLVILILIVILGALGSSAVYIVDEREKAIVFQFGEIVAASERAGIYFKVPIINNVKFFDARIQTLDATTTQNSVDSRATRETAYPSELTMRCAVNSETAPYSR